MGNSITEGWAKYFPTMFPGKPYIGRGISGQTTPQMLVRFRQDVVALDYHSAMADKRQGLRAEIAPDGVHPNEAGYRIMAPLVEDAIAVALTRAR